jgi:hypothetical protein
MLYYRDVPTEILDELWRRFKLALLPLSTNAKLAAAHFQFAPWVINDRDGIAHVATTLSSRWSARGRKSRSEEVLPTRRNVSPLRSAPWQTRLIP